MKLMTMTVLALMFVAGVNAHAGMDMRFSADVPVGDDGSLFLSISSRYFDRDRRQVEDWSRRYYPDPDDLAVALFLSRHCGRGPEFAFNLRKQGLGWFEISNRCEVPVDVYFLEIDHDPGPPYGKAYGHWKKRRHDGRHVVVLDDDDIRNLVAARMAHEYYGVPVAVAMQWRASGQDIRRVMTGEYRNRHEKKDGHGRDKDQRLKERGGKAETGTKGQPDTKGRGSGRDKGK